jgi:eukaryotic-like serine/threonine-protein kinase
MKFTYSSGQRPLDGYTIKRGIGRGGFGEVYYAVSDGGKEVALKLVRGNFEVELRGVAQCLNLKHPHLVSLFDLRHDAQGDHWVVMEYIAGEPLSVVLSRHPQGLPGELVKQWFLALARATGYLHDHGLVHRDLKPGNIFLESGLVKVGDYGLSKFISGSQRNPQTQSVGTVHYMAPEISSGNYGKQIDVYAAGVILYEMLTGRVPFDGESVAEILMKHLTSPPDLSKVPADYLPVVSKALAKNPAHRYATMAEMARAVEAAGTERAPVREPVVKPVAAPRPVAAAPAPPAPARPPEPVPAIVVPSPALTVRCQMAELCGSLAGAALLAVLFAVVWTAFGRQTDLPWVASLFFHTVAVSWVVLTVTKGWPARVHESAARRLVMLVAGASVGIGALWLNGWLPRLPPANVVWLGEDVNSPRYLESLAVGGGIAVAAGYLAYFGLAFCLLRWWKLTDRQRSSRFSFFPVLATGFWAVVLLLLWPWSEPPLGAAALVMASVIVHVVSPWEQPPPPAAKRVRLRYA